MNISRSILSIFLVVFLQSFVEHQADEDCMTVLKEAFRKMTLSDLPKDQNVYYFDYAVTTNYRGNISEPTNAHVKAYLSQNNIEIVSNQMEVYQDKVNTFTVVPIRKMIYWTRSDLESRKNDSSSIKAGQEMGLLKDKIFDKCVLKYCKNIDGDSHYDQEILIEPSAEIKKASKINSVKFFINRKRKSIYKTIMDFDSSSPQQSVEVVYMEVDFDHKHNFNYTSKSKIFKSDGALQSRYTGYKVVDVRNNKK